MSGAPPVEPDTQNPHNAITHASAIVLSDWIRRREVSCVDVMRAYLQQIERWNPHVNAIVSRADPDELLAQAARRDSQLAAGRYLGPLHGLPMAPKDLAAVRGMPTTYGSPLFRRHVATEDATFVSRLRDAGALFVGRTNTPEFGLGGHTYNTVFGTTRNAYHPRRSAGGSSGGAAAAVALRMLPFADGSDMMGSLRTPAAYHDLFGFRPTPGLVPRREAPGLFSRPLTCDGPMARSMPDLAMLLGVMAGDDPRAARSPNHAPSSYSHKLDRDFKGTRIGWLGDLDGYLAIEAGVLDTCEQALHAFEDLGCVVEPISRAAFGFAPEHLWSAWLALRSRQMATRHGAHYSDPRRRAGLSPEAVWEIEHGLALTGDAVLVAAARRGDWIARLRQLFARYDYLVLPAAQTFPFDADLRWPGEIAGRKMDTYHRWLEVAVPASLAGVPVISAPAGVNPAGLPMGLQLMGPEHADLAVMQLAHRFDVASGRGGR